MPPVDPSIPCNDDLTTLDAYGDDCTWYDVNPQGCGMYDDDDFTSSVNCCACGGGALESADEPLECVNDDSATDCAGDTCSDWYDDYPDTCGGWDTLSFNAQTLCCACGGGIYGPSTGDDESESRSYSIEDFVQGVRGVLTQSGCNEGCIATVLAAPQGSIRDIASICDCDM